jgi:hypothetical protein
MPSRRPDHSPCWRMHSLGTALERAGAGQPRYRSEPDPQPFRRKWGTDRHHLLRRHPEPCSPGACDLSEMAWPRAPSGVYAEARQARRPGACPLGRGRPAGRCPCWWGRSGANRPTLWPPWQDPAQQRPPGKGSQDASAGTDLGRLRHRGVGRLFGAGGRGRFVTDVGAAEAGSPGPVKVPQNDSAVPLRTPCSNARSSEYTAELPLGMTIREMLSQHQQH